MLNNQALIDIVNEPSFIFNLFDAIRLVDPLRKEVRSYIKANSEIVQITSANCYEIWGKNATCENCISMRSLNSKRTTTKIELGNSRIFMVTAVPLNNGNSQASIVELIKDITQDGIINIEGLEPADINKLISHKNELIIKDALTKIYNEQYIFERLPNDLLMSKKQGTSLALFVIKINNLEKLFNPEIYQRQEQIIKDIANIVNMVSQNKSNWASRFHETGFILVMHGINETKANRICQRIRNKIGNLKYSFLRENIKIATGYHIVTDYNLGPEKIIENTEKMMSRSEAIAAEGQSVRQHAEFFDNYLLTSREREVLVLISKGNSNSEIADKLFIGLSTVKKHTSSLFVKTKTKSRAELIAKYSSLANPNF